MEFSWLIFVSVAVFNFLCIGAILVAQALDKSLPPRNSAIPGTRQDPDDPKSPPQKFLYIQDFWTMTWGDGIGVLLIVNAFVHLAVKDINQPLVGSADSPNQWSRLPKDVPWERPQARLWISRHRQGEPCRHPAPVLLRSRNRGQRDMCVESYHRRP